MPNGENTTRIAVNETKIDTIQSTLDRIETKIDGISKGVVWWKQVGIIFTALGVFTAMVAAYLKYAPMVAALLL